MKTGCVGKDRQDPVKLIGPDFGPKARSATVATVAERMAFETAEIARRFDLAFTSLTMKISITHDLAVFWISGARIAMCTDKWAVRWLKGYADTKPAGCRKPPGRYPQGQKWGRGKATLLKLSP